jgi:hypothetical protein
MAMEFANAASERRVHETAVFDAQVCIRLPSPPTQQCVHDQKTDIPGLPEVWTGI